MKLKKKKSLKNRLLLLFILIMIFSIFLLYYISNKVMPSLLIYSENIVKEEGISLVSENVTDRVINILDKEDLFNIDKDNEGNIESIDYNSKVVNEIIKESSLVVQDNFNKYKTKNNSVVTYVPIFSGSNNVFLENLGPKVPIKLVLDGNVVTSLETNVKEYGYNSALIEISIKIEANTEVILPFKTKKNKIVNYIPISIKIVQGNINSIFTDNVLKNKK